MRLPLAHRHDEHTRRVERPTLADFVARANRAISTPFNTSLGITTDAAGHLHRDRRGLAALPKPYRLAVLGQGACQVVFGAKGADTCQRDLGTRPWHCLRVMGMGPSMPVGLYPPGLAASDLAGTSLVAAGRGAHQGPGRTPCAMPHLSVVVEYIHTVPGNPRRIVGRSALVELYRPYGEAMVLHRCFDLVKFHDREAGVVVLEYASEGHAVTTGAALPEPLHLSDHDHRP